MPVNDILALTSFSLYSLYDLRYRLLPGIEILFVGAAIIMATTDPLRVLIVTLAVAWYTLNWSNVVIYPLLLSPASWLVLFTGYAARKNVTGRADVFAVGSLAILFPFPMVVSAYLGFEIWRRWWVHRDYEGPIPTLPGFLIGMLAYFTLQLLFVPFL